MQKRIALLIKKIIDESPYDFFSYQINPNPEGGNGFWGITIMFEERNNAHSESLIRLLKPLGMVYGEGLGIIDNGSTVEVS